MTQISSSDVPGMGRRQFMNLLTFGSVTGVALGALYPVANYFIPPKAAGSGGVTELVQLKLLRLAGVDRSSKACPRTQR